jgi:sugar phosphate isomerase/epimerase
MCFITNNENLEKTPRDKLERLGIESIKICAKYAEDHNVKLLLEPLFKNDITIVNTCEKAVELWSKALNIDKDTFIQGNMNYGLLQDIFHMHHEETNLLEMIRRYNKITYHIHIADHPRGLDFTRSDSRFVSEAIKVLKAINYQHYISFESFNPEFDLNKLEIALKTIKSFES